MRITISKEDIKRARKLNAEGNMVNSIMSSGANTGASVARGTAMSSGINSANMHGNLK